MRQLVYKLITVILLSVSTRAVCQLTKPNDLLFSSFFAEKNLSSLNITCLFQDTRGNIWIGTEDGLNYFNGKTIRAFKHDRLNKNSLTDNLIGSICEDQQGFIWIGTSYGISKLDPQRFTFTNYTKDASGKGLDYKMQVYVDRENNIWAHSGDLFKLDKNKDAFRRVEFKTTFKLSEKLYTGIFEDSKKRFWLSTSENLYRFDPITHKLEFFRNNGKAIYFFQVKENQQGRLFCGTWDDGIYEIDTLHRSFDTIESKGLKGSLACQFLNQESILWYGNRLSYYNLNTGKKIFPLNQKNKPFSVRSGEISALLTDNQNQLWIGYLSKGIQILSPSNQAFTTYNISEKENMFPVLNCYIRTKQFSYAGGWYNYSLAKLDTQNKLVKTFKTIITDVKQTENNISDAWHDGKGNVWFTTAFGLVKFNEATEKTERYHLDTTLTKRSFFLQILPEGDSALWLSGYFCGLSRFSLKNHSFQNWGAKTRSLYWGITRDHKGMIWLADNSGILTGFDPIRKKFITKDFTHLTEGTLYTSITFDKIHKLLWIGCSNGLLRIDPTTFAAKLFTEKDNLPTNQVNGIQVDAKGRLWIATGKGLCFYDSDQGIFRTFSSNSGLPGNNLDQLFKLQNNGDLYIGFPDGFSVLKTQALNLPDSSRRVSISKVVESGKIIPIRMKGIQKTIELKHHENNIQVEFSSNDLINSEDNQLLYRLEGQGKEWSNANDGIINFNKLAPGKYLIEVSAINHNGIRCQNNDSLLIIIDPPYWKTTWFILLLTSLILGLILLAARYVFTRNLREKILILEKEQAIEKERTRISQDMHDELGSGLTKISILSEVAKTQLHEETKAKAQLETISASSRELVDNLQDIIWILNSKNDSLENLCAYLREYALKYFEALMIDIRVDFPEKIPTLKLSEDQRRNILLVFKETFNNISKHSEAKKVEIQLRETDGNLIFTIKDNGKGFDKNKIRTFANGLHNMEKRMKDIHGNYSIESFPNGGTTSEFSFKI